MHSNHDSKPSIRRQPARLLGFALLLASVDSHALTFLVGADAACDFNNVQAAIDAAQVNGGPDTIRIATNQTYSAQHLRITGQDLEMAGGYPTCANTEPVPGNSTVLSGFGVSVGSVLTISGHGHRTLRRLTISAGNGSGFQSGGGINYFGSGTLLVEHSLIAVNRSGTGGGISFHGDAAGALLTLGNGTVVRDNTALLNGGGVRVSGNALLTMPGLDTTIWRNKADGSPPANGYGGGVYVEPPAAVEIGSPGLVELGAIHGNTAAFGGGIALRARNDNEQDGYIYLYTTDPVRPVRVANNRASVEGGAVFMRSDSSENDVMRFCAEFFRIDHNRAPQGSAIYAEDDALIAFNACEQARIQPLPESVGCTPGVPCNEIVDNVAENIFGDATNGGTVVMPSGENEIFVDRLTLARNRGGPVWAVAGDTELGNCALIDNDVVGPLVDVAPGEGGDREARFGGCTIAGNTISGTEVFRSNGMHFGLTHSIVQQPGRQVLAESDALSTDINYLLVSSCGLVDCGGTVTATATGPRFVDPARGDYRLQAASRAVDFGTAVGGPNDLDGFDRIVDLPLVANRFGVRDLGAYERQSLDPILLNGGFVEDTRFWTEVMRGSVSHERNGASGTLGAVYVNDDLDPTLAEVVGLKQCVPLPGPGNYALTGLAYGDGIGMFRDRVSIRWRFFAQTTSNGCTGTPTRTGTVNFPRASDYASPVAGDQFISVSAAEFNERTQVEITLVVTEGSAAAFTSTSGRFDQIVLFHFAL